MKNKKLLVFLVAVVLLVAGFFLFFGQNRDEQEVLESTYDISKEYLSLRYRTDNILVNAREYESYDAWNTEVESIIQAWEEFGTKASKLEENASKISQETMSFNFVQSAYAYDTKEVQAVIESAPAGKTVRALAQHF